MWLDRESVKVARNGAAEAGGAVWARIWVPPGGEDRTGKAYDASVVGFPLRMSVFASCFF